MSTREQDRQLSTYMKKKLPFLQQGLGISYEALETRVLLAGDIQAQLDVDKQNPSAEAFKEDIYTALQSTSTYSGVITDGTHFFDITTIKLNEWQSLSESILTLTLDSFEMGVRDMVWSLGDVTIDDERGSILVEADPSFAINGNVLNLRRLLDYSSIHLATLDVDLAYTYTDVNGTPRDGHSATRITFTVDENVGEPFFVRHPIVTLSAGEVYTFSQGSFETDDPEKEAGDTINFVIPQTVPSGATIYNNGAPLSNTGGRWEAMFYQSINVYSVTFGLPTAGTDEIHPVTFRLHDSGSNESTIGTMTFIIKNSDNIDVRVNPTSITMQPSAINSYFNLADADILIPNAVRLRQVLSFEEIRVRDDSQSTPTWRTVLNAAPFGTTATSFYIQGSPTTPYVLSDNESHYFTVKIELEVDFATYSKSYTIYENITMSVGGNNPPTNLRIDDNAFQTNDYVVGTFTADDLDNDSLTYSLNHDYGVFDVVGNVLTATSSIPLPAGVSTLSWMLTATVSDGHDIATLPFTVSFLAPSNQTVTGFSPTVTSIDRNLADGSTILTIDGLDPDVGDDHIFSIIDIIQHDTDSSVMSVGASIFSISNNDQLVFDRSTATNLNLNTVSFYEIRLSVRDRPLGDTVGTVYTSNNLYNSLSVQLTGSIVTAPPSSADATISATEDVPESLTGFVPVFSPSVDSNSPYGGIVIESLPQTGTLASRGNAVVAGQTVSANELMHLVYTPQADLYGTGADSFTFRVFDMAGATSTAYALAIDLAAVNDPITDVSPDIISVVNGAVPQGALVTFTVHDPDSPTTYYASIGTLRLTRPTGAIITRPATDYFSDATLTLQDLSTFSLSMHTAFNHRDYIIAELSVEFRDELPTSSNPGTPYLHTLTIYVDNNVIDPDHVTITEDVSYRYPIATYSINNPNNNYFSFDIANVYHFRHDGSSTTMFTSYFSGSGLGIAMYGSVDYEQYPEIHVVSRWTESQRPTRVPIRTFNHTVTISVIDDLADNPSTGPSSADGVIDSAEDQTRTLDTNDISFTDPDVGDVLTSLVIVSAPSSGQMWLAGQSVVNNQTIDVNDISSIELRPDTNSFGSPYASFVFEVINSSGETSPTYTMVWNVSPEADDITSVLLSPRTVAEGTAVGTTIGTFSIFDPDDSDAYSFTNVELSEVDPNNNITPGSSALSVIRTTAGEYVVVTGQTIDYAVTREYLLTATIVDYGQGTRSPGQYIGTFSISVGDTNDPITDVQPTVTSVDEDIAPNDTVLSLTIYDNDIVAGVNTGDAHTVIIDRVFGVNGGVSTEVTIGSYFIVQGNEIVTNRTLDFETYSQFLIEGMVIESGSAQSGPPYDFTLTINVNDINDAIPTSQNFRVETDEDVSRTLLMNEFLFIDTDQGDQFTSLIIQEVPTAGSLWLGSQSVTNGQSIDPSSITLLELRPESNSFGDPYDMVVFRVMDASGNVSTDYTLTWAVNPTPDAPTSVTLSPRTVAEGAAVGTTVGTFSIFDPDGSDTYSFTNVELSEIDQNNNVTPGSSALSTIRTTAGEHVVVTNQAIDYAVTREYLLTATIVDYGQGTTSLSQYIGTFSISVGNTNDPITDVQPTVTSVDEDISSNHTVLSLTIYDNDIIAGVNTGDAHTVIIDRVFGVNGGVSTEVTAGSYFIVQGNEIVTNRTLDFETYSQFLIEGMVTESGSAQSGPPYDFTLTINVNDINDTIPTSQNFRVETDEDVSRTLLMNEFLFIDADQGDQFTSLIIQEAPTAGSLWLGSQSVTNGQSIDPSSITLLELRPESNSFGDPYDMVVFRVMDAGGNVSTDYTLTWAVNPLPDAPTGIILDNDEVAENVPQNTTIGTISVIDDDPNDNYNYSIVGISRVERNPMSVLSVPNAMSLFLPNNQAVLLTNESINYEESVEYLVTVSVQDLGASGSQILFGITETFTITILNVNDPIVAVDPSTADISETATMGTDVVSFTIDDEDNPETHNLLLTGVTIVDGNGLETDASNRGLFTVGPSGSRLLRAGVGIDYEEFQSAKVTLEVTDTPTDPSVQPSVYFHTVTISIIDENDETPTSSDISITIDEDTVHTFSTVDFDFQDRDQGDMLTGVKIISVASNGRLLLNGVAVSANDVIAVSDVDNLSYVPAENEYGAPYDQFIFSVLDAASNESQQYTTTIEVRPVNDAPTGIVLAPMEIMENQPQGTTVGVLIGEDVDLPFDVHDFSVISAIRVSRQGVSTTLAQGDFEIQNDNQLVINADANFEVDEKFVVKVRLVDSGSEVIDRDLAIVILDANDPITSVSPQSTIVDESQPLGTTIATLDVIDEDINDVHNVQILGVSAMDATGNTFIVTGLNLVGFQGLELIVAGVLDYELFETITVSYEITDNALGQYAITHTLANQFTIMLRDINDEFPTSSDATFDMNEDATFTFQTGTQTIEFNDRDSGDALSGIVVNAAPDHGVLVIRSQTITSGQTILNASLDDLRFVPDPDEYGQGYATLDFRVLDGAANASGPYRFVWNVINVNDIPTAIHITPAQFFENTMPGQTIGVLSADDSDPNDVHTFSIISTSIISRVSGVLPSVNTDFRIVGNQLVVDRLTNYETTSGFVLRLEVDDGSGVPFTDNVTLQLGDANDLITGASPSVVSVRETEPIGFTVTSLTPVDEDVQDNYTVSIQRVMGADASGVLVDITGQNLFSFNGLDLIVSGGLDFETYPIINIDVQITDQAKGGAPSSTYDHSIRVNLINVNDEVPETDPVTFVIDEDTRHRFDSTRIAFRDNDQFDALAGIRIESIPVQGQLLLNGQTITAGQVIAFAQLNGIEFVPEDDAFGSPYASVLFSVYDLGGNYSVAKDMVWDVTPVNDPPISATLDNNVLEENQPPGVTVGTLTVDDPDPGDVHSVSISSVQGFNQQGFSQLLPSGAFRFMGLELIGDQSFDFELTSSVVLNIEVSDGTESTNVVLTITITDANDPITAVSPSRILVAETVARNTEILVLEIEDQDQSDQYSVTIQGISSYDPQGNLLLASNTTPIRFEGATLLVEDGFDYETHPTLVVELAVTDSGYGDPQAMSRFIHTMTIIVLDINDEHPMTGDNRIMIDEDTEYIFSVPDFSFSSTETIDIFTEVEISLLPTRGALEHNGQSVTVGQRINIGMLPRLHFTPAENEYGQVYTTWEFKVVDQAGLESNVGTMTIDVAPVNDSPEDITINPNKVAENNPGATIGTFDITDVDIGDSHEVTILEVEAFDHQNQGRPLAQAAFSIVNGELVSNGSLDYETTDRIRLRVRAIDSGLGDPNARLSIVEDVFVTVVDRNDPITSIVPLEASISETATMGTEVLEVIIRDPDQSDSHGLVIVGITSDTNDVLPADLLRFDGTRLIVNGDLDYETASILLVDVRVSDSGLGDPMAVDIKNVVITVTILDEQDEQPQSSDATFTLLEDESFTMGTETLAFRDADQGDVLAHYVIVTLPNKGRLLLQGNSVNVQDVLTPTEWAALVYVPETDEFGTPYTSFEVSVRDTAGLDSDPVTVTFEVVSVNDDPRDIQVDPPTVTENTAAGTVISTLTVIDPDIGDQYDLSVLRVRSVAADGAQVDLGAAAFGIQQDKLTVETPVNFEQEKYFIIDIRADEVGGAVGTGASFVITLTVVDVNEPIIDLLPDNATVTEGVAIDTAIATMMPIDEDENGQYTYTILGVSTVDAIGSVTDVSADNYLDLRGADLIVASEIDYETTPKLLVTIMVSDGSFDTQNVVEVAVIDRNDEAPTSQDINVQIMEDTPFVMGTQTIHFMDSDSNDNIKGFEIVSLPASGTLMLGSQTLAAGDVVAEVDIASITYLPNQDYSGQDQFGFKVHDQADNASPEYQFSIDVTPVNDAPTAIDAYPDNLIEDQPIGTTFATLSVDDPDSGDVHQITILSAQGQDHTGATISLLPTDFSVNGLELILNRLISYEDFIQIELVIKAEDDGVGGSKSITGTVMFDVINVNDLITDVMPDNLTVTEGANQGTNVGVLTVTDNDKTDLHTVSIISVIGYKAGQAGSFDATGWLSFNGLALQVAGDIDFETYDKIELVVDVSDSGQGNSDDVHVFGHTMTVDIIDAQDEPPTSADVTFTISEDTTFTFGSRSLVFMDPDVGDALAGLVFDDLPTNGQLLVGGVTITAGQIIGHADLPDLTYIPAPDSWGPMQGEAIFRVLDQQQLSSVPYTMVWDVQAVNDPVTGLVSDQSTVEENLPLNSVVATLTALDLDAGDTHHFAVTSVARHNQDGSIDNLDSMAFTILNNTLLLQTDVNFEIHHSFVLEIDVTDQAGGSVFPAELTLIVVDANDPITEISPTMTAVDETATLGSDVIVLNIKDEDVVDDDVYTLSILDITGVASDGTMTSLGDSPFGFEGLTLRVVDQLDYETYIRYFLHVEVSDSGLNNQNAGPSVDVTLTIDILPHNDEVPEGVDLEFRIAEDTTFTLGNTQLPFSDRDDQDQLTEIVIAQIPSQGRILVDDVELNPGDRVLAADLSRLTFVPDKNGYGEEFDTLVYRLVDGGSNESDLLTITWHVDPVNDAPTGANLDPTTVDENVALGTVVGQLTPRDVDDNPGQTHTYDVISVVAFDADGNALGSVGAAFVVDGDRLLTNQQLDYEQIATYIVQLRITDGGLGVSSQIGSGVGEVTVTVNDLNEAPEPNSNNVTITIVVGQNVGDAFDVSETFTDPEDDDLVVQTIADGPSWLTLVDGDLTGTADEAQLTSVTLEVVDSEDLSATAVLYIEVLEQEAIGESSEGMGSMMNDQVNSQGSGVGGSPFDYEADADAVRKILGDLDLLDLNNRYDAQSVAGAANKRGRTSSEIFSGELEERLDQILDRPIKDAPAVIGQVSDRFYSSFDIVTERVRGLIHVRLDPGLSQLRDVDPTIDIGVLGRIRGLAIDTSLVRPVLSSRQVEIPEQPFLLPNDLDLLFDEESLSDLLERKQEKLQSSPPDDGQTEQTLLADLFYRLDGGGSNTDVAGYLERLLLRLDAQPEPTTDTTRRLLISLLNAIRTNPDVDLDEWRNELAQLLSLLASNN